MPEPGRDAGVKDAPALLRVELGGLAQDCERTAAFFTGVDLFARPSLYEGLGVAALAAMAAGKPVVATRVGGLTESVLDGVTGVLVPPRDAAALAAAIARLARSRSLAQAMGHQGRARARQHFSLQNMALQNESYYYEIVGAPS